MNIGNFLLTLRKSKQLSQEEVAEELNVSRQTVSKWETDQTTPDFDKIQAICDLYGVTPNELLAGQRNEPEEEYAPYEPQEKATEPAADSGVKTKRALGISLGILLYFAAIAWIIVSIPFLQINPIAATGVFMLLLGVATFVIVFAAIRFKGEKQAAEQDGRKGNSIIKQIRRIIALVTLIAYFVISFLTGAWYITWILWIVCPMVTEIISLIYSLKGEKNNEE